MTDPHNILVTLPLAVDLLALGIAACIFCAIVLLVVGLFGQRGETEMTAERQMALAVGHADRDTLFENPLAQPIMWLLLRVAVWLPAPNFKRTLRRQLITAGNPNFYSHEEFLAVALLMGLVLALLAEILMLLVDQGRLSFSMPLAGMVFGFGGTVYGLFGQAARRVRNISKRVPYTLDLISLAMGAGATFTEAVRTVVREDPTHPFNVELNTVLAEMELGTTRRQALTSLSERIPLDGLRSIIAAVVQAEQLGTPLSDVLKQQADLLRLQRSVRAEKAAASASVRILLPGVLILISVVLTVFGPVIIRALKGQLY